jgi:hypothetical protein
MARAVPNRRFLTFVESRSMTRLLAPLFVAVLTLGAGTAAAQGISWYGKARTKQFVAYCKPGLANKRSVAFRYCDTVWNAFKEGYFAGLDTANMTCFIDHAQLGDLIAHIEDKGEEYVDGTGWVFAMRDFIKLRLKECQEKRSRNDHR